MAEQKTATFRTAKRKRVTKADEARIAALVKQVAS